MDNPTLGPLLERLKELFLDSYDTQALRELLLHQMNRSLGVEVSDSLAGATIVFDLMAKAKREGWLLDLVRAARDRRQDRKPEWIATVAELESALGLVGGRPQPASRPLASSDRQVALTACPPDVLIAVTQQLVAAAATAARGERAAVKVTVGDWSVRVDVNPAAFDTWGAGAGLDAIGRRVAGHRRQIDHYQKQRFGPFAVGVDFDHLISEQSAELTAALDEMANRLRPFVRAVWRVAPRAEVT